MPPPYHVVHLQLLVLLDHQPPLLQQEHIAHTFFSDEKGNRNISKDSTDRIAKRLQLDTGGLYRYQKNDPASDMLPAMETNLWRKGWDLNPR